MRIERDTVKEIALRIKESRRILERAQYRISQTLEGFETLHETVERATYVLGHTSARSGNVQIAQK